MKRNISVVFYANVGKRTPTTTVGEKDKKTEQWREKRKEKEKKEQQ